MVDPNLAIRCDDWESVFREQVPEDRQRAYREAIVKFRYWLRETGKSPVAGAFKEHLDWKQSYLPHDRFILRRKALRWYYQVGRDRMKARVSEPCSHNRVANSPPVGEADYDRAARFGAYHVYGMNDVPMAGAKELGGPAWKKALVRRIRERNLAWKCEKTYRAWCRRFTAAFGNKPIDELDRHDVRGWLSHLAVRERVSVATQAQALNAVVFFFREVLQRDPGDFSDSAAHDAVERFRKC